MESRSQTLPGPSWNSAYTVANDSILDMQNDMGSKNYNWPVLFLFLVVMATIGGNILVCMAVRYERKLQNMFNFFLVSLALSDMLSAMLVMPLSIIKALYHDNLPLPKMMCVAWYSLDVLFTSSTICHLCMISIDRYLTFKYPLRYGHSKKRKSTILKIFLVWLISLCIAGPLFLLSMFDKQSNVHYKGCGPESPVFVISATVASFYLPLLIMIVMYALTVKALRHQLQEQRRLAVTNSLPSREGSSYYQRKSSPRASPRRSPRLPGSLPSRSPDAGRSSSNSLREYSQPLPKPDPTTLTATTGDSYLPLKEPMHFLDTKPQSGCLSTSSTCTDIALQDLDDSSDTIQTTTTRKKHLKVRIFRFRQSMPANERSRRVLNGPDRGRRAVQVLGILFVVFVIFYLPFFAVYVINGTCVPCREYISPRMIMAFEWLQYTGSTVNPIVYHIFNPDFRRAFSKILHTQNCCK